MGLGNVEWGRAVYAVRAHVGYEIVERPKCFLLAKDGKATDVLYWSSQDAGEAQRVLKCIARGDPLNPLTNEQLALVSTLECMSRLDCPGGRTASRPDSPTLHSMCNGPNDPEGVVHMLTCHMCQTIIEIRDALGDCEYEDPTLEQ
jgi:hypothetical protein